MSRDIILGPLPDLFLDEKGKKVTERDQWPAQRESLLRRSVPLAFGGLPPAPERFDVRPLYHYGERVSFYRVIAGTKEKTVEFELKLYLPEGAGPFPVVLTGDGCFSNISEAVVKEAAERGYIIAVFNRTMLAEDAFSFDRSYGLYPVYPDLKFGAIAAWVWGYSRCVDALERMERVDPDEIAVTGHSRGGKTTLLAGAVDERIKYVESHFSGTGGSGCFRYIQNREEGEAFEDPHSELLENMLGIGVPYPSIGFWFGPELAAYAGREQELPFDMHFLKAAIAPRFFLQTDSVEDVWANPKGSWQTYQAAKEVYRFLGIENRMAGVWRYGKHEYALRDFRLLLDYIDCMRMGDRFIPDNADSVYEMERI